MKNEKPILLAKDCLVIEGWMLTQLHLKGNELIVYACIYSFSKTDEHCFKEKIKYLMAWTNSTKQNIIKILKSLQSRGLIEKIDLLQGNKNISAYRSTKFTQVGKQSLPNEVNKVYLPAPIYNIYNHNNINNITNGNILRPSLYNRQDYIIKTNIYNRNSYIIEKENTEKEKETNTTKTITLKAIKEYAETRGRPDLAEAFYNYYTADKDRMWLDSNGKPVKNWKQKFTMWVAHDKTLQQSKNKPSNSDVLRKRSYSKDEVDSIFENFNEIKT